MHRKPVLRVFASENELLSASLFLWDYSLSSVAYPPYKDTVPRVWVGWAAWRGGCSSGDPLMWTAVGEGGPEEIGQIVLDQGELLAWPF